MVALALMMESRWIRSPHHRWLFRRIAIRRQSEALKSPEMGRRPHLQCGRRVVAPVERYLDGEEDPLRRRPLSNSNVVFDSDSNATVLALRTRNLRQSLLSCYGLVGAPITRKRSTSLRRHAVASSNPSLPLWFGLLQEQGREATGLTPSFLIGADMSASKMALDADTAYYKLCALLESFCAAPAGYHVVISPCSVHGQPIAALYEPEERKPDCETVLDHGGNATALYADRNYFAAKRTTLELLTAGLWRIFEEPLTAGEYSYRNERYCALDDTEGQFISRVRKRLDMPADQ
jgi:hypothetical protein